MNRYWRRLGALRRRGQLDKDIEDELRYHREMQAIEESPRRFGNVTALKETCRELWEFTWIETLWRDIRYGVRTLAANPGFTATAVIALALGIGANTAIYTITSSALNFEIGAQQIDRLVVVTATDASRRNPFGHSFADFLDLRSEIKTVPSLAAYRMRGVNVGDSTGLPELYRNVEMSANGFEIARMTPALGRNFTSGDERRGATPVVILAYHLWQDRYGRDPSILGRVIRVDDVPRTVIGVMPSKVRFPEDTDLWTPLAPDLANGRGAPNLMLFGRLAEGVKLETARAEMDTVARRLQTKAPDSYQGLQVDLRPFLELIGVYEARRIVFAVVCAVGFVLLIACADVANLLLARAAARAREISIRVAIGAGRARIVRQLLIESVLLASVAGTFGWMVALGTLRWFDRATYTSNRPSWIHFSMDLHAFVYLAAISIGAGILFGLAPALRLAKVDVNSAVKDGGHGTAGGRHSHRLAGALVVFEMVLCIVLMSGAGLMIRSAVNSYNAPIGVNFSSVLTMSVNLPEAKYPKSDDEISFHRRLKAKLESLPGVESVSLASAMPSQNTGYLSYELDGRPPADPRDRPLTAGVVVGADYFRVLQVRARRGRVFNESDGLAGAPAVIVNETFAGKAWPGEDPIGKRLRLIRGPVPAVLLTVVGLVPDIKQNSNQPLEWTPLIYVPYAMDPPRAIYLLARTTVPPLSLAEAFRREVRNLDRDLPVYDVATLEHRVNQNRLNAGIFAVLFTMFAGVALVLAAVGLYAVVANSVSQRTREIGVRRAVGGTSRDIARLVFSQALRRLAIGLAIGLPLGVAATFVLRAALIGVSPGDPLSLAGAALVLIVAGLLGCAIPARRAVRVDPIVALRCD